MDIIIGKVAYNLAYNAKLSEKEFLEQHTHEDGPSKDELKEHYKQIKAKAATAEPKAGE